MVWFRAIIFKISNAMNSNNQTLRGNIFFLQCSPGSFIIIKNTKTQRRHNVDRMPSVFKVTYRKNKFYGFLYQRRSREIVKPLAFKNCLFVRSVGQGYSKSFIPVFSRTNT